MKFGEKLRVLRAEKGVSRSKAAEAIGITKRTYLSYELEGRYPRKSEVYGKLAEYFECDVNYLRTEDEEFVFQAGKRYGSRGKRQAEQLVQEISGLFAGGSLAEEDRDEMMRAIQEAYWKAKEKNRKYVPEKYRSGE